MSGFTINSCWSVYYHDAAEWRKKTGATGKIKHAVSWSLWLPQKKRLCFCCTKLWAMFLYNNSWNFTGSTPQWVEKSPNFVGSKTPITGHVSRLWSDSNEVKNLSDRCGSCWSGVILEGDGDPRPPPPSPPKKIQQNMEVTWTLLL